MENLDGVHTDDDNYDTFRSRPTDEGEADGVQGFDAISDTHSKWTTMIINE